jgi:hypothetical protein
MSNLVLNLDSLAGYGFLHIGRTTDISIQSFKLTIPMSLYYSVRLAVIDPHKTNTVTLGFDSENSDAVDIV